jgi:predicted MFS family arabinose efflux permease
VDIAISLLQTMRAMIDPTLLLSPSFAVLAVSGFFSMSCFFVPFTYLQPQAELRGLTPTDASTLITILGVANIVSRVVSG